MFLKTSNSFCKHDFPNKILCFYRKHLKELYSQNFERALKSMTCVQIESIHIDDFKNVKKNLKMVPCCHGNYQKFPKMGKKCFHVG